jgi:hypothetical protein
LFGQCLSRRLTVPGSQKRSVLETIGGLFHSRRRAIGLPSPRESRDAIRKMVERIACRYSFLGGPPQIRALVRQSERSQKITRPGKLGARQAERKLALERTAKGFRGEKKIKRFFGAPRRSGSRSRRTQKNLQRPLRCRRSHPSRPMASRFISKGNLRRMGL